MKTVFLKKLIDLMMNPKNVLDLKMNTQET